MDYMDDATGLTHFHAACMSGCQEVCEKFLDSGQDPNCLWRKTGDSPLHLALKHERKKIIELLLRRGADPNWANENGSTPLHVICTTYWSEDLVKLFFEINDENDRSVLVDARDNEGRTPLQVATANFLPCVVDLLLEHGADVSGFVFYTESHLDEFFEASSDGGYQFKLKRAARILAVVESLEKGGYELSQSDTLTIMKSFARHGLYEMSAELEERRHLVKSLRDDAELAKIVKELSIRPGLSFYDLISLRPEKAKKLLTYANCSRLANSNEWYKLPTKYILACLGYVCETMLARFRGQWAVEFFWPLTRHQLPILCCDVIIEKLSYEDLLNACLAALGQS